MGQDVSYRRPFFRRGAKRPRRGKKARPLKRSSIVAMEPHHIQDTFSAYVLGICIGLVLGIAVGRATVQTT